MSQQLVKKGTNGKHENVMPKSWIEAIKDKNTGQTLVEILQGFNMYFLPYNGNTSATRCLVPMILRKKGLWITYVKYDGNVYTEWYAADEIDDKSWGDSSNWRIGNNTLVGDITISANGNWVINGTETKFKAVGEKGNTPLLRVANNRLQVSYDLGDTYRDVTSNPVYTKFRWLTTSGDTQANNVGRIQASTDEGKTWTNMSNDFINNLHISRYIGINESLPTSGIAEGTIYAKGPYYAEDDTLNDNPIYRLWVYAWKGNTLAWQDNGEFTSIAAGIVQETGDNETTVMSQKATTEKLTELATQAIYDVTANNGGATFDSLSVLLSSENLSTLIPTAVRCGGMSIRFIQGSVLNSDNKYVQYRLMTTSFSTTLSDWQCLDDELDKIYNGIQGEYNIDITTQQEVDYGIDYRGKWLAKNAGEMGTSYVIPINSHINKITCKNNNAVDCNISFLKDIDNMTVQGSEAHFVDGATERLIIPANSSYKRDIPAGTNYIATTATISSGVPSYIVDFVLYSNDAFDGLIGLNKKVNILNKKVNITETIESSVKDAGNIDISELPVVDASIDVIGIWRPTEVDVSGKSLIIDNTLGIYTSITLVCHRISNISFLKSIPSSFTVTSNADFAEGESERRVLSVGVNTFDIPIGTNYISILCETSTGTDIAPTSIQIDNEYISGIKSVARKEAKGLISVNGQEINDGIIYLDNMPNLVPISDPLKALSSGECNAYHEVVTGFVYVVCIEGFDSHYEALDCCSLYVFSLTNPNNVKRYQFAQKIDNSKKCYTPNIVPIGTKQVRVFYSIQNEDSGYCYYRDFNFNTETFTEPQRVTLSISGDLTNIVIDSSFHDGDILTGNMIRKFTIDNGGATVSNANFVYIEKITDEMSDGYRYATICCGESISYNLVLARSDDNFASIEFVDVTPYLTRYDCAVAGLNNKLYFVHRVAGDEYAATSGSALFTADITDLNNIVWSNDTKFAEGDSRTDCYQYDNKIYLMAGNYHSVQNKPMRVSSSVWEGVSDNPSDYTKVLVVSDTRGVQNPRVFRYGVGDYGVLMQNSPARVDYANGLTGQRQFKTAVCFVHTE